MKFRILLLIIVGTLLAFQIYPLFWKWQVCPEWSEQMNRQFLAGETEKAIMTKIGYRKVCQDLSDYLMPGILIVIFFSLLSPKIITKEKDSDN